jgi:hypothetical protein
MKKLFNKITVFLITLLSLFAGSKSNAQVSNYKAYTLFVYNFTKYIQWPDGAIKNEFVIGVFGKSPIYEELQKMGQIKKVGDKTIRIVELSETTLDTEVHILFVPEQKSGHISGILAALKGKPVLLVSEKQGLVEKGAGISFLSDNNNLKFEMNSSSIAAQNLTPSKTLEALAFKN